MDNQKLSEKIDYTKELFGDSILPEVPEAISSNLKNNMWPIQEEAFKNFLFYENIKEGSNSENLPNVEFVKKDEPSHLMFNMATGSGKTMLMAACILHYMHLGYRKFLFITNQTNILDKTEENLINKLHHKYLFDDQLMINSERIELKKVNSFSKTKNYEIRIETIQSLHLDLQESNQRENINSLQELNDLDLVILADEAHHFNVMGKSPKSEKDIEENWENTILNKIFRHSKTSLDENKNKLLEFTATIPEEKNVLEKYQDKIIYNLPLKEFREAGLTKEINIVTFTLSQKEKILYALVFNWYRHKVALKHGIKNFKPVILFRRKTIDESKNDYEEFLKIVKTLTVDDFNFLSTDIPNKIQDANLGQSNNFGHTRTSQILEELEDPRARNELVDFIKENFNEKSVVITNSKDNKKKSESITSDLQKQLNNLEDPRNLIRAIFTVQRLTEGWDVQNLYDIVRMDEGVNEGGTNIKVAPATVQEAQLIGRAVRYFPFNHEFSDRHKRKFDQDLDNELRILEEFFYFTYDVRSRYLSEISKYLREKGYVDGPPIIRVQFKDKFIQKNKKFYNSGVYWINEVLTKDFDQQQDIEEHDLKIDHTLQALEIVEQYVTFSKLDRPEKVKEKTYNFSFELSEIEPHILNKALNQIYFNGEYMSFSKFKDLFNIENSSELFLNTVLSKLTVSLESQYQTLEYMPNKEILRVVTDVLKEFLQKIIEIEKRNIGTEVFIHESLNSLHTSPKRKIYNPSQESRTLNSMSVLTTLDESDWYITSTVLDEKNILPDFFPGTDEEMDFCLYVESMIPSLKEVFRNVFLMRNEEKIKLYNYKSGIGFQPDYILYLQKNEKLFYYVLIEPKGPQLINTDAFKELFLKQVNTSFGIKGESQHANNFEYKIVGLPFYTSKESIKTFNNKHKQPNQDDRSFENFDDAFKELLK